MFIFTWVTAQTIRDGYDPIHDAISRLAELGAPRRWIVSTGMVVFGVSSILFATALRDVLALRFAAIGFAVAGLASLGVALFPCTQGCPGMGQFTDTAHTLAAGIHYLAFVTAGVAAWAELEGRAPEGLRFALLVGPVLGGLLLLVHGTGLGANGLFQRAGLTTNDAWMIALAYYALRAPSNTERE